MIESESEENRRLVLAAEMEDLGAVLNVEPKNYHAWQYRQFLFKTFHPIPYDELCFCQLMILEDVFNNSAWNYRFFLVSQVNDLIHDCSAEFRYIYISIRLDSLVLLLTY